MLRNVVQELEKRDTSKSKMKPTVKRKK